MTSPPALKIEGALYMLSIYTPYAAHFGGGLAPRTGRAAVPRDISASSPRTRPHILELTGAPTPALARAWREGAGLGDHLRLPHDCRNYHPRATSARSLR